MISFKEALEFVSAVKPLGSEDINPVQALDRVLSEDVCSMVDCPPCDSSLKDGFALRASDIENAAQCNPVTLPIRGCLCAGQEKDVSLPRGGAIRIMTGARIPQGANAVLPQELASFTENEVKCLATTQAGRNILARGADLIKGEILVKAGSTLSPGTVGLLVGAGVCKVQVYTLPRVVIVATGSELAEEGRLDESAKIFPSNRATIASWMRRMGLEPEARLCRDEAHALRNLLADCLREFDVIITSGGVLDGERDLVVSTFEGLGVEFLFKRVRMGPGKGVCMGRAGKKLVFNLPGGPPSNYVAFLFVALPSVLRLMGVMAQFPPLCRATLTCGLKGRWNWTQLVLSRCRLKGDGFYVTPMLEESRLKRIAFSDSVIIIPEGVTYIGPGESVRTAFLETGLPPGPLSGF